jgi:sigma-B regulation protein RsbU (phosphoserine phosphatase)
MTAVIPEGRPELREDFNDFFDTALCGFLIASPEGRILRINARLAGWIGKPPADFQGALISDILTIAGKMYYETHLGPLLRMQGFFDEIALELALPGKERLPVIVNALERRDQAGVPVFIRVTIFKATERRRYERDLLAAREAAVKANNELRELNATLGQRVADEVKERLNLEGTLFDERHSATLREQFIAVLGHDLRNPLASIDGGLRLIERTPLNEKALTIAAMLRNSVARMADIIENVMDFARGRLGGGFTLNRSDCELEPVLLHVVQELRIAWSTRVIESEFSLGASVNCDPGRISQLLSNLIANALTHGAADGPVCVRAASDHDAFEMSVANLGDPIPSAAFERLFKPFTRDDVRPSQHGLGLGLYIASEIAGAHGGVLSAASSAEETRFTFRMQVRPECS